MPSSNHQSQVESSDSQSTPTHLANVVKTAAATAGFGSCGIAAASAPDSLEQFSEWLDAGYAGKMAYIEQRRDAYAHPKHVLQHVRSVVMVTLDYRTQTPAASITAHGRISRYAWGRKDYHSVIREKLAKVADALHQNAPECRTRAVVDTAPLLERDFARRAGLGWFGKNTMLISKSAGSFFFIGALLTDADIAADTPHETSHCGTCTACLDACPTSAFVEPHKLDARRCISYATIELKSDEEIPETVAAGIGDWIFGCDVCQDVCPWNSKAPVSTEPAFQAKIDTDSAQPGLIPLKSIFEMTEADFAEQFAETPLERTGLGALQRNARAVQQFQSARDHISSE